MCDIGNEVSELCQAILNFQIHINSTKQKLFLIPEVCDTLIWNHIIGGDAGLMKKEHLYQYLSQNKAKFKLQSIQLLFHEYSTTKHQHLTRKQFISIFVDQSQKCIYQLMNVRNAKYSYAKNYVPHFKITDLLVEILIKTLEFLQSKQKMKQVIYTKKSQFRDFSLTQIDAPHFLILINKFKPQWQLQECQIILRHIIKYKERTEKQFYYFFVPFNCQAKELNPDQKVLKKNDFMELKQTYSSIIDHRKTSHFGNKPQKFRKTLYLK